MYSDEGLNRQEVFLKGKQLALKHTRFNKLVYLLSRSS